MLPTLTFSQDLVYKPVNPSFGGNYLNYSWLLNSAEAQNTFTESESESSTTEDSELDDFKETLQSQILYQLSKQIVQNQFGEGTLEDGSYEIGDFQIDITSDLDGVIINITDISDGSGTTITVPYY